MATCPFCGRYAAKKDQMIEHMNKYHGPEIEKSGWDAAQNLYASTHDGKITGKCMCGCGRDTLWNPATSKPFKVSTDPGCRARLSKRADENMLKVYGKTTLLDDMERQKEMLEHRHTSGKYKFRDGDEVGYASQLEKNFLRFCDLVMDMTSNMVQDSPEVFPYFDQKDQRWRQYAPDFYLPDYNLLVEIKDEHNTNKAFLEGTRYKVEYKDQAMREQKKYNYIRISGRKYGTFVETLYHITHNEIPEEENVGRAIKAKPIVVISESALGDTENPIEEPKPSGRNRIYLSLLMTQGICDQIAFMDERSPGIMVVTAPGVAVPVSYTNSYDIDPSLVDVELYMSMCDLAKVDWFMYKLFEFVRQRMECDVIRLLHDCGIEFTSTDGSISTNEHRMSDFIRWTGDALYTEGSEPENAS